jgi:hypothetical protein
MSTESFEARLQALGIEVSRVPDLAACRAVLVELVGTAPVLMDEIPGLAGLDQVRAQDPWDAEVGISEAFSAAADAGAVALVQAAGSPRRTSLLPPRHIVVTSAERIRDTYQEMVDDIARLDPPPTGVQLVSGASRSGDIESAMIHGMHGPRRLTVLVVG